MARKLHIRDADFDAAFAELLSSRRESHAALAPQVAEILAEVRSRGDAALFAYTAKWDNYTPKGLKLDKDDVRKKASECAPDVRAALETAAKRIAEYSKKHSLKMFPTPMISAPHLAGAGVR